MIQMRTMLKVADNSGAKEIMAITPQHGAAQTRATLGDVISATVKLASPDGTVNAMQQPAIAASEATIPMSLAVPINLLLVLADIRRTSFSASFSATASDKL